MMRTARRACDPSGSSPSHQRTGMITVPSAKVNSCRWLWSQRASASSIALPSCSNVAVRAAISTRPGPQIPSVHAVHQLHRDRQMITSHPCLRCKLTGQQAAGHADRRPAAGSPYHRPAR